MQPLAHWRGCLQPPGEGEPISTLELLRPLESHLSPPSVSRLSLSSVVITGVRHYQRLPFHALWTSLERATVAAFQVFLTFDRIQLWLHAVSQYRRLLSEIHVIFLTFLENAGIPKSAIDDFKSSRLVFSSVKPTIGPNGSSIAGCSRKKSKLKSSDNSLDPECGLIMSRSAI
ncbi:hypothetical protein BU26DRAFT_70017 [Trematosphaeria pertusa]|uniref:Uncharacterized protein n=1 Tax=Trematosphaeria pertusa TaxID=390896 RepID=A0A6A6I6B9_9PLEO|nr:uncharacterized protein BU26DRAFT_70017 [Trematosphaeria pertusa]KAF2245492.1 hypothetical protein BU26DRAFT_70017 [Trematosphaeria pertusa]